MSNITAPDNWETQADSMSANNSPSQDADVTPKFSTLNVNAVEFVPSFAFSKSPTDEQEESPSSNASEASPEHRIPNGTRIIQFYC